MSHTHTIDMNKIQALADRTRAFDEEYNAIIVLQHATPEVRPCVVACMQDYMARLTNFECDLAYLSRPEHAALNVALGLDVWPHVSSELRSF